MREPVSWSPEPPFFDDALLEFVWSRDYYEGPLADACERDRSSDPETGSPIVFAEDCYR